MTDNLKKISAVVHISEDNNLKTLRSETDRLFVYTVQKAICGYTADEIKQIISCLISKLK